MSAHVVETAGGAFISRVINTPDPASDQVLVKIYARGVHPLDTKMPAGLGGHANQPLPVLLRLDRAGLVVTADAVVKAAEAPSIEWM